MPTEPRRRPLLAWALLAVALALDTGCRRPPDLSEIARARLSEASRIAAGARAEHDTEPAGSKAYTIASPLAEVWVETTPFRLHVRDLRTGETVLSSAPGMSAWIERDGKLLDLGNVVDGETTTDRVRLRVAVDGEEPAGVTITFVTDRTIETSIEPARASDRAQAIGVAWGDSAGRVVLRAHAATA